MFQIIRFLWVVLIICAIILAIQFLLPLLYPFLIALIIALAINRPVTYLTKKARFPRWLSVSVLLLLILALLGGLMTLIITEMVVEIGELIKWLPIYLQELTSYLQVTISEEFLLGIYSQIEFLYNQLDADYQQSIDSNIKQALETLSSAGIRLANNLLSEIQSVLLSLPNLATVFIISLLAAFFISKDYVQWRERMVRLMPSQVNVRLKQVTVDLRNALFGFVRAQVILISITAVIVMIGLIILRVEYAITIALLTGLVELLPYLGTGTVFIPWIIYLFFKGNFDLVIGLSILYAIIVVFRQIIEPKVLADSVGLDPLLTLVALFVGLKLFGFLGLIIGPVSMVVINALIRAGVFRDIWEYIKGKPIEG